MAEYIINEIGSPDMTLPKRISKNDILKFNITNSDIATKYTGTMLTYTFPFDCTVTLKVAGARGGRGAHCDDSNVGAGAILQGDFNFLEGDTLLICVGQAGTDNTNTGKAGSTGAGGGGTFVVLKDDKSSYVYNGKGVGNGWKVTPLIVAGGGNGGGNLAQSKFSPIHASSANTGFIALGDYHGGGFERADTSKYSGESFLNGASGGTYAFTRYGSSYAGFGGGGSNREEGPGSGGGGFYGANFSIGSASYIDDNATNIQSWSGPTNGNIGEGYFTITFLNVSNKVNAKCKVNGEIKTVTSMKVKVDGEWKEVSTFRFKSNGTWK